ncbi:MAG: hypothetical protein AAF804_02885, partial [Bacteroidota bacterium]
MYQYIPIAKVLLIALLFLPLRGLSQPVPSVSQDNPESEFINEDFCFEATFDLSGDPGYGPYLRIMLPPGFTVSQMQFLGGNLAFTKVGAFPMTPKLFDPIGEDTVRVADGAVAGDTLFVADLPIGSVVATTPELTVSICGSFNDDATIDSNYTFTIQPGLEFGDTPTGTNGLITGIATTGQTKPKLIEFTKDNDAPEEERPPGPSWPFTYSLTLDVAEGKTLTNLSFVDVLPTDVTWVGSLSVTGGVGCVANYDAGSRTVSTTCTSVTGASGSGGEVVLSFDTYVSDILDETTCTKDQIANSAFFEADFGATDVRPDSARDTLQVELLSIQTSAGASEVLPGDTLSYSSNFQFTDYDESSLNPLTALSIQHILPAGLSFDDSFTPTISLSGGSNLAATAITAQVDTLPGEIVQVTFDVIGVAGNINDGTAGTLTFKALIRQGYDFAASDPILARDSLAEATTATYSLSGKASNCTDNSSAVVRVSTPSPALSVENIPSNGVCWVPREIVTFKLTLNVNSGDTEGITFQNFFPLPVFDVSELDTDNFGTGFDIRLAPDHSDLSFVPSTANITKDLSQNSLTIVWPDLSGPTTTKTLSVLVDLPIDYQPFDDGLLLSDIFRYETVNSSGSIVDSLIIDYLNICAPDVELFMGIYDTDGEGSLDPSPVGNPVASALDSADAGDEVSFELTVVNQGGAPGYDIILKDTTTEGLTGCALIGLDPLTFGDGTALDPGLYSGDLFGAGLTIDSIFASGDASRRDTIRIRYTCNLKAELPPDTTLYNQGRGQWRSVPVSVEADAELFPLVTDSIAISSGRPDLSIALSGISPNGSGNGIIAVPGDTLTYLMTVTLAEGQTPNLVLSDTLPEGCTYGVDTRSSRYRSGKTGVIHRDAARYVSEAFRQGVGQHQVGGLPFSQGDRH